MKNLSLLLGMILLLLLGACLSSPSDYNTAIMDQAMRVEEEALNITRLLQERNFEEAQSAFQRGRDQTRRSLERLERISAFRGDDSLRQAAIRFVVFYNELFTNEYQEALDLLQKGELTMEESGRLSEILIDISRRGVDVKEDLVNEHLAFIRRYGLIVARKPQPLS